MDSMEKFENKEFPKIEDFYSMLNEEHISEKDYNHAKEVWNAFRIKNMGEYHDLYLQSDVLLLTDIFKNFRNTCMQYYSCPTWHGSPLINMQKSVFLPLWDNYELYGRKILHIKSFSAIESENLVRISKFFV